MSVGTPRSPVEQLLAEGIAQVQQGELFAKAAADPLDQDFEPLDQAQQASDAAYQDDEDDHDDQGSDPDADDDEDGTDPDADPDDDGEDQDDDAGAQPGGVVAKADGGFIDAMPLLRALDDKFDQILTRLDQFEGMQGEVSQLRGQVTTLAKSVQASTQGTLTIARAIAPHVDAPVMSKSQQAQAQRGARVPTSYTQAPDFAGSDDVYAKAEKACDQGLMTVSDVSLLNGVINSRGIEGAREALPRIFQTLKEVK